MVERDKLADCPFSYSATKDGKVRIHHDGRLAKIIKGKDAAKFLAKLKTATERDAQLLMAKLTGQYKIGTE